MGTEWTRADLPSMVDAYGPVQTSDGIEAAAFYAVDDALGKVVEHLNAHHPKPDASSFTAQWNTVVRETLDRLRNESADAHPMSAEARTAPAVTKADIENAIRNTSVHYDCDCTQDEACAGFADEVDAVWSLVSGADPAVHVVRESDLPAAEVHGDHYVTRSERATRRWPKHGYAWWEEFAQKALADAAQYTALARLAASEATVDPVEAKARELWEVVKPSADATWSGTNDLAKDQFRKVAAHVLG